MKRALSAVSIVCALGGYPAYAQEREASHLDSSVPGRSRIYQLEELTWPQIDALDRERTLFLLPVGMVEEHGPHLPVGADTLAVRFEAEGVSKRVSRALPEWKIVMMPPINYGHSGANNLGDLPVHPGTYAMRQSTMRSLVADLGAQVGQNGFKWIFVMNGHGAPTHNIAINEACDFVSVTYGVTMLHLTALFRGDPAIRSQGDKINARHFSTAEVASFGMDVHAGVGETSGMLALRPDLVRPSYKTLPSQAGRTLDELREVATAPGWQGYLSSPAMASPSYGRAVEEWWMEGFTSLILRAVRGENLFTHPRFPDRLDPAVAPFLGNMLENERAFETKLENWLAQRGNN